jgi:hypothetical protein
MKGAMTLGSTPYIPYTRRYESISTLMPPEIYNYASSSIHALLGPLKINDVVCTSLTSLSILTAALRLSRLSGGAITFEPHEFTDEYICTMHQLVTDPCPLRAPSSPGLGVMADAIINPYSSNSSVRQSSPGGSSDSSAATSITFMADHRLRPGIPVIPTEVGPGGPVEPALRIAGLLYLKEILPEWPRNIGGYAVLLSLLRSHLYDLLDKMKKEGTFKAGGGGKGDDSKQKQSPSGADDLVDSSLRFGGSAKNAGKQAANEAETTPKGTTAKSLRAALVFVCLMGDLVSLIGDRNEHRIEPDDRYPRAIFRHCLREALGLPPRETGPEPTPAAAAATAATEGEPLQAEAAEKEEEEDINIHELVKEEDLLFLRLFDLRIFQGEDWDDREALRAVLAGNLASRVAKSVLAKGFREDLDGLHPSPFAQAQAQASMQM